MHVLTEAALCSNSSANADVLSITKEEAFADMNNTSLHLVEQLSSVLGRVLHCFHLIVF